MKDNKNSKKKFKLNLSCIICGKEIYIGDGSIINKNPVHFECFKKNCYEEGKIEVLNKLKILIYSKIGTEPINYEDEFINGIELLKELNFENQTPQSRLETPNKKQNEESRKGCMLSINNTCHSDYNYSAKCDGLKLHKNCPYIKNKCKTKQEKKQ